MAALTSVVGWTLDALIGSAHIADLQLVQERQVNQGLVHALCKRCNPIE